MYYFQTEVAGKKIRRNRIYARGVPADEKLKSALRNGAAYQAGVEGIPTPRLTAEALRKANKTPSRLTKSTASRVESAVVRSDTTTTSIDNEDINTIVKGTATLKIGNAEVEM